MHSMAAIIALALFALQLAPKSAFGSGHEECRKALIVAGQPSRLRALAQLNAVRDWALKAEAIDRRFALWHNAADRQVDCKELSNSSMIRCVAKAKPCPAASLEPSQKAKN